MNDLERIAALVGELVDGWRDPEPVRWQEWVQYGDKRRLEARAQRREHPALLLELRMHAGMPSADGGSGHNANKPQSKPPGSLDAADLLLDLAKLTRVHAARRLPNGPLAAELRSLVSQAQNAPASAVEAVLRDLSRCVHRAKIILGYEEPRRMLRSAVCSECGGGLWIIGDDTGLLRCAGSPTLDPCGNEFHLGEWYDYVRGEA